MNGEAAAAQPFGDFGVSHSRQDLIAKIDPARIGVSRRI
jgi:hypothetical protein